MQSKRFVLGINIINYQFTMYYIIVIDRIAIKYILFLFRKKNATMTTISTFLIIFWLLSGQDRWVTVTYLRPTPTVCKDGATNAMPTGTNYMSFSVRPADRHAHTQF